MKTILGLLLQDEGQGLSEYVVMGLFVFIFVLSLNLLGTRVAALYTEFNAQIN